MPDNHACLPVEWETIFRVNKIGHSTDLSLVLQIGKRRKSSKALDIVDDAPLRHIPRHCLLHDPLMPEITTLISLLLLSTAWSLQLTLLPLLLIALTVTSLQGLTHEIQTHLMVV